MSLIRQAGEVVSAQDSIPDPVPVPDDHKRHSSVSDPAVVSRALYARPGPGALALGLTMRSREADMRVQFEVEEGQPPGTVVGTIPTKPNFTYRFNERPPEFVLNGTSGVITTAMEIDREVLPSERFDLIILSSQPTYPLEVRIVILDINDNPLIFPNLASRCPSQRVPTLAPVETRSFYQLNISAQDGGTPPRLGYLLVNVTILDVNDNPPIFDHSDYSVSLNESVPPGTSVLQVRGTDNDIGDNARIIYFLSDTESQFTVDPLTDANDHDPSIRFRFFPSTASYATVDENAQNGSVVAAVSVIDLDEGPNGETWGGDSRRERVRSFRLESTPSFDIVRVNEVPRHFLIIHVNDVNDHEPIFEKNEYSAVLAETVQVGTYVAGISATDEDTGVNSDIYYAIVSGNDRRWFDIDVHTGLVTTSDALNREDQDYVELKISARDGGPNPRWTYTYLRIQILDQNDEAPSFAEDIMNVTLIESSPPNSLVAVVTAVDNDLGTNGSVEYFFHPDVERLYPNKFLLDLTYGRLTLREQVDREEIEVYNIPIIARDQGTPSLSSTATVRITILDVNDNKPYFYPKQYFYTLHSSDMAGTAVAKLLAIDADIGKNAELAFTLVSGGEGNFEVDKETGIVKTKTHFTKKREISKYEMIVAVHNPNDRTMSDEAVVLVYIGDAQHRTIQFSQSKGYNFVIEEDMSSSESGIGREVGRVSVKSRSMRSGVKYSIVDGDQDEWFHVEDTLGIINTACSIDREVHSRFSLQVVAYDFLGFTRTTVNITVTDLNDFPPTFEHPTEP
ncbi:cadherin-related tumor suppressor [Caerostris extrusa]|uniref:Cadherin-related tumor suppressor n=1 Tax=Caerostris extrusa TaxID=172846 RepID=A0AAV4XAH7_CAEEX|nr:cadherin-related tumor suppressor [Caerostris extrusa]